MKPDTGWQVAASAALDSAIVSKTSLGGGDSATSYRAVLADGRQVFVKTHADPPPGFFSTEAQGLGWLREAVPAAVPEVLAVDDDPPFLALAWVQAGRRVAADEDQFGRMLADLHRVGFRPLRTPRRATHRQSGRAEPVRWRAGATSTRSNVCCAGAPGQRT